LKIYEIAMFIVCVNASFLILNAVGIFNIELQPGIRLEIGVEDMIDDIIASLSVGIGVAFLTRVFIPQITTLSFYATFLAMFGPFSIKSTLDAIAGVIPDFPVVITGVVFGITTIICFAGAIQLVAGGWRGVK
jgi:hypothetical protein